MNSALQQREQYYDTIQKWIGRYDDVFVGLKETCLFALDVVKKKEVKDMRLESIEDLIQNLGITILTGSNAKLEQREIGVSAGMSKYFTTDNDTLSKRIAIEKAGEMCLMPNIDQSLKSISNSKKRPDILMGMSTKALTYTYEGDNRISASPDGTFLYNGVRCPIELRATASSGIKAKKSRDSRHQSKDQKDDNSLDLDYESSPKKKVKASSVKGRDCLMLIKQPHLHTLSEASEKTSKTSKNRCSLTSQGLQFIYGCPSEVRGDKSSQVQIQLYCMCAPFGLLLFRSSDTVYYEVVQRDAECSNFAKRVQINFLNNKTKYDTSN